jgi:stress-induced morphogen
MGGEELAMNKRSRKRTAETRRIEELLKEHFPNYPSQYPPVAYRYNSVSIRVRLVHDLFKGKSLAEREDMILPLIRQLPEKIQADITILLLLTPKEVQTSMMNLEFENPTPSLL